MKFMQLDTNHTASSRRKNIRQRGTAPQRWAWEFPANVSLVPFVEAIGLPVDRPEFWGHFHLVGLCFDAGLTVLLGVHGSFAQDRRAQICETNFRGRDDEPIFGKFCKIDSANKWFSRIDSLLEIFEVGVDRTSDLPVVTLQSAVISAFRRFPAAQGARLLRFCPNMGISPRTPLFHTHMKFAEVMAADGNTVMIFKMQVVADVLRRFPKSYRKFNPEKSPGTGRTALTDPKRTLILTQQLEVSVDAAAGLISSSEVDKGNQWVWASTAVCVMSQLTPSTDGFKHSVLRTEELLPPNRFPRRRPARCPPAPPPSPISTHSQPFMSEFRRRMIPIEGTHPLNIQDAPPLRSGTKI
ncbi:hypothetical protein B0H14DRAFT_3707232 [Mycena olivaceomarginata]|nr:hypothetical protein B0H14DRAFT_3707232 [Mycena olivaceomarginata]